MRPVDNVKTGVIGCHRVSKEKSSMTPEKTTPDLHRYQTGVIGCHQISTFHPYVRACRARAARRTGNYTFHDTPDTRDRS